MSSSIQALAHKRRCRALPAVASLSAATLLAAGALAAPARAIFNGYDANPQDFPWYVTLTWDYTRDCGGAVIAPATVITAAHCVSKGWEQSLKVVFGYRANRRPTVVAVKRVAENHYDESKHLNDIAILFLDRNAPSVKSIGMLTVDPPLRSWLTAVGFGCASPPYSVGRCTSWRTRLQGMSMQRVPQATCGELSQTDFCVTGRQAALNHGDSGGPVMLQSGKRWQLAGLTDLVVPDANGPNSFSPPYQSEVTSIAQQRSWIDSNLRKPTPSYRNCSAPPSLRHLLRIRAKARTSCKTAQAVARYIVHHEMHDLPVLRIAGKLWRWNERASGPVSKTRILWTGRDTKSSPSVIVIFLLPVG